MSESVAVVGLGRIGLPLALSFADRGLRVVGVDREPSVLAAIRDGRMPFHETGTEELLMRVLATGRLELTDSVADVVGTEHIVLTLGTPAHSWTSILRYTSFALPELLMMNCEQYGATVFEVIDLINHDYPRGGIATPGLTAGTCLRKDFAFSGERSSAPGMLLAVSRVHESMPRFVVDGLRTRLGSLRDRKIAVLGLTFKRDSGDLRNTDTARRALDGCEHVIHLAAIVGGIGNFHKYPHTLLENNHGLYNAIFQAAVEHQPERLTYVSSSMVFENATRFPTREE